LLFLGLVHGEQKNPVFYIIRFFRLLLRNWKNNSGGGLGYERELLQVCRKIFASEPTGEVFLYMCKNGAATAWVLEVQLSMSTTTVYEVIKRLRGESIVEPVLRVPNQVKRKGGPLPRLWGLSGYWSDEEAARAITLHYRSLSPKYRAAEKVAQAILDDFYKKGKPLELRYSDIFARIKVMNIPYAAHDIAEMTSLYLHERGVKIWR
jgi:hypothetical protein